MHSNYNIVSLVQVLNMFYKVTKVSVIILIMTQIVKFPSSKINEQREG